jgi:hypothetical protein
MAGKIVETLVGDKSLADDRTWRLGLYNEVSGAVKFHVEALGTGYHAPELFRLRLILRGSNDDWANSLLM